MDSSDLAPRKHESRSAANLYSFEQLRRNAPAAATNSSAAGAARSLASFMGSSATGPVLNKPKVNPVETDLAPTASFLSKNPALLQHSRIALPGLAKPETKPPISQSRVPPRAATAPEPLEGDRMESASIGSLNSASVVRDRLNAAEPRRREPPLQTISLRPAVSALKPTIASSTRYTQTHTSGATPLAPAATLGKVATRIRVDGEDAPLMAAVLFESDVAIVDAEEQWEWRGRRAPAAPTNAKRRILQGCEDDAFLRAIGGTLVTRLGARDRLLDSLLFRIQVRSEDLVLVDEVAQSASSICSAFCYVRIERDATCIWRGRGSTSREQTAALTFAESMANTAVRVYTEAEEASLFWKGLANVSYANANHWRFRSLSTPAVRIYQGDALVSSVPRTAVSIVDAFFELYVLVPPRCDEHDALAFANRLARAGDSRLFPPPIHMLDLPSILPLDLACLLRCDMSWATEGAQEMRVRVGE